MATITEAKVDELIFAPANEGEPAYAMEQPARQIEIKSRCIDGRRIGVGIVDARELGSHGKPIGETIFVAMGYASVLDEFEQQRFAQMAAERRARVVIPEYPGVGMATSKKRFSWGLARGSFKKTGKLMARAAGGVAGLAMGERVTVMGYSQGAAACIEIASEFDKKGINVDKLTFVEPVSNQRHFLAMGARIGREGSNHQRYFDSNKQYGLKDPLDVRLRRDPKELTYDEWAFETNGNWRGRAIVVLGGVALMWNRLNARLEKVLGHARNGLQDAEVSIIQFDQSIMSRRHHNERTLHIADRAQEAARMRIGRVALRPARAELLILSAEDGLSHPAWHSVPLIGKWLSEYLRMFPGRPTGAPYRFS